MYGRKESGVPKKKERRGEIDEPRTGEEEIQRQICNGRVTPEELFDYLYLRIGDRSRERERSDEIKRDIPNSGDNTKFIYGEV